MERNFTIEGGEFDYRVRVWIHANGSYDVMDVFSLDAESNTEELDPSTFAKDFRYEIESEIEDDLYDRTKDYGEDWLQELKFEKRREHRI